MLRLVGWQRWGWNLLSRAQGKWLRQQLLKGHPTFLCRRWNRLFVLIPNRAHPRFASGTSIFILRFLLLAVFFNPINTDNTLILYWANKYFQKKQTLILRNRAHDFLFRIPDVMRFRLSTNKLSWKVIIGNHLINKALYNMIIDYVWPNLVCLWFFSLVKSSLYRITLL